MNAKRLHSAIVVTHVYELYGPPEALAEFLRSRVQTLVVIMHPFYYCQDRRSKAFVYVDGQEVYHYESPNFKPVEALLYLRDFIFTLYFFLRIAFKRRKLSYDLFVGADCLNASSGIFLNKLKMVKKTVFYVIDYTPQRFENSLKNRLYQRLVKFATRSSDFVWNSSNTVVKISEQFGATVEKNMVVPHGVYSPKLIEHPVRNRLVFVGHLVEKGGVQLVLEALPAVIQEIPSVRFYVLGTGPYEGELRQITNRHHLEKCVIFLGAVPHDRVMRILPLCDIGVAPYLTGTSSHLQFAETGLKIVEYLACRLPVITTEVPAIAREVKEQPLGLVVDCDRDKVAEAIIKLLTDKEFFHRCKENTQFTRAYEWDEIFSKALKQLDFVF